jgi:hypothetical protein
LLLQSAAALASCLLLLLMSSEAASNCRMTDATDELQLRAAGALLQLPVLFLGIEGTSAVCRRHTCSRAGTGACSGCCCCCCCCFVCKVADREEPCSCLLVLSCCVGSSVEWFFSFFSSALNQSMQTRNSCPRVMHTVELHTSIAEAKAADQAAAQTQATCMPAT